MRFLLCCMTIAAAGLLSCTKTDNDTDVPENTSLELTLKDESGRVMTDGLGYAQLYGSVDDWSKDMYKIGEPKFADANGKIIFTNLSAKKYYWRVENGCRNNFTTSITTPQPLTENALNKADVPMVASFSLSLKKRAAYASAAFNIYINNGAAISAPQGTAETDVYKVPAHSKIRILQTSGFTGAPVDTIYNDVSTDCGQTFILNYPN